MSNLYLDIEPYIFHDQQEKREDCFNVWRCYNLNLILI